MSLGGDIATQMASTDIKLNQTNATITDEEHNLVQHSPQTDESVISDELVVSADQHSEHNHSQRTESENAEHTDEEEEANSVQQQLVSIKEELPPSPVSEEARRLAELKISERWGESFNVYDDSGQRKKVIDLDTINNYMKLDIEDDDYDYYIALVNARYPRFFRSTPQYTQRWRMRYNIFVGSLFDDAPNNVLFYGEIHLYFDIISRYSHPFYVNSSLYKNRSIVPEVAIDERVMTRIDKAINDYRFSKAIHQLKFPFKDNMFSNTDTTFDKFIERQTEFDEDALLIHDKYVERAKKFGHRPRRPRTHYSKRSDTNDNDVQFEDTKERIDGNAITEKQPRRERLNGNVNVPSFGNYSSGGANRFDRGRRFTPSNSGNNNNRGNTNRFDDYPTNEQSYYRNSGKLRSSFGSNYQKSSGNGGSYDSYRSSSDYRSGGMSRNNGEHFQSRNNGRTTYRRQQRDNRPNSSERNIGYYRNSIACGGNSD